MIRPDIRPVQRAATMPPFCGPLRLLEYSIPGRRNQARPTPPVVPRPPFIHHAGIPRPAAGAHDRPQSLLQASSLSIAISAA